MRSEILSVVCVKSKPDYDYAYVNKLYAMVKRNMSIPFKFLCLTDDSKGIKCRTRQLPRGLKGWWAKLALFTPYLQGPVLYLDLDTIIIDSLDFVEDYEGDFAILRDFYRPDGYGSGVMLWNKPQPHVWDNWNNSGRPNHELGDQGWMEQQIKADLLQDIFPGKFVSFKADCEKEVPEGAAVVCFHGLPKPADLDPAYEVDCLLLSQWQETLMTLDQRVPEHVKELLRERSR